jgi:hypothetical protein
MKIVQGFLFLCVMVSCSTLPLTGRKQFAAIPSSQMIALSEESYAQNGTCFPGEDGIDEPGTSARIPLHAS